MEGTAACSRRPYSKPPTTYTEQVDLLRARGMVVDDQAEAEFYLQHLNYYRLGAYWLPFEQDHATHHSDRTHFSQVLNLYIFDRELRLLVLDALERLEVSVRTQWADQLHTGMAHMPTCNPSSHSIRIGGCPIEMLEKEGASFR